MLWFTADTHFGHTNIIRYTARPFRNAQRMDAALVSNWNSLVSPNDNVLHLGDFGFGRSDYLAHMIDQLNGRITLIRGSHDMLAARVLQKFACVLERATIMMQRKLILLEHVPSHRRRPTGVYGCFHGHIHRSQAPGRHNLNVCVDRWDFCPVPFDVALATLQEQRDA